MIKFLILSQKELERYYREKRAEEYDNGIPIKGIAVRRKIHRILLAVLAINRYFSKNRLCVISDKRTKTDKPIIYACNHIGWDDIELVFAGIEEHCYIFLGDPRGLYRRIEGLLLYLNGVIYCDTDSKTDRHIGKERCIELLQQGGSLLIFPEGAWNVTENEIVMKLFTGTAEMAIRGKAEIVPLAVEERNKTYYINIGKNIDCSRNTLEDKKYVTQRLRDEISTLRWEIWEKLGVSKREDISVNYYEMFLKSVLEQSEGIYTLEDINKTKYHEKI